MLLPGSSKCVTFVPFHQKDLPKGRNFTQLEDTHPTPNQTIPDLETPSSVLNFEPLEVRSCHGK